MCANRYTLLEQGALRDVLPAALDRGVGVVIAGVHNSGLLAQNRPATNARYDYEAAPDDVVERTHRIEDVCEEYGVTVPAVALAFVRAHPAVIATVVGGRSGFQVGSNVERARTRIPSELWEELLRRDCLTQMRPSPWMARRTDAFRAPE
jgi:D-threo-aldose 1-dehydrogenase